jgi:hypothetical protein
VGDRDALLWLWRLAGSDRLDARVRDQLRAAVLLVLIAQLLAAAAGDQRPARGRFGTPVSWRTPRRARPPYRGSLSGRRPRG